MVRKKSRKDQQRASPLPKTVRMLRMTTKRMATRMTSLLPVLQMIMLPLERTVKSNNQAAQQVLIANKPP